VTDGDEQPGGVVVVEAGDGVAEVDGMPPARLAASWRMRRSPPEQGRPPPTRAAAAASQSMAAVGAAPSVMLVPYSMNLLVKSSRCRKAQ
jgi:hypothetical protein